MTDLEIYQHNGAAVTVAHDIDSWTQVAAKVIKLAEEIYDTPFVPDGLRGSVPATAAAILAGRELGLGPMTSLANIHVIKGKPALSAALMRALILAQGHQIETVGQITDTRVVVRGRRRGESAWEEASFTADQARQAKIDISGYPQDKLYARATSRLARRKFADVIAGMPYSAEELEDGPDERPAPDAPPEPKPAQRTARRQQAAPKDASPAQPPAPVPAAPVTPLRGAGEAPLPPLPGEEDSGPAPSGHPAGQEPAAGPEPDDTDFDTPGTVTRAQLTKLGATFTGLGFTAREREQRLVAASQITGRELESSSELSKNEAGTLIDTLERCGGDREKLIAILAAGEGDG